MTERIEINLAWSPALAYSVGLMATDGCLSKNGRHLNFTSNDLDLIKTFKTCLGIKNKVGYKWSSYSGEKVLCNLQFGNVKYYRFLLALGLTPAKSKTLKRLAIPDPYFPDFFRGCLDGDGNISIQNHPESQYPQLRIRLYSASQPFLVWLHETMMILARTTGGWIRAETGACCLTFAKADSIKILNYIYYSGVQEYLERKRAKAEPFLRM